MPVRVTFVREFDTNYHANEWEFDGQLPSPPPTDEEFEAIDKWVDELDDDGDDGDDDGP